jgi:hypothetical protein
MDSGAFGKIPDNIANALGSTSVQREFAYIDSDKATQANKPGPKQMRPLEALEGRNRNEMYFSRVRDCQYLYINETYFFDMLVSCGLWAVGCG